MRKPRQGCRQVETFTSAAAPNASLPFKGTEIALSRLRVLIQEQSWRKVYHFQDKGEDEHFQLGSDGLEQTRIIIGESVRNSLDGSLTLDMLSGTPAGTHS